VQGSDVQAEDSDSALPPTLSLTFLPIDTSLC
jgi:hypothetical protein